MALRPFKDEHDIEGKHDNEGKHDSDCDGEGEDVSSPWKRSCPHDRSSAVRHDSFPWF